MFFKFVFTLATLAAAQNALAQPACLLAAVNKFQHPADQKTLCCQEASKVKDYIQQLCASGDTSSAVDAFNSACKSSGYGTCSSSSSSKSSASKTATASGSLPSVSAPYPVIVTSTSTYFDTVCSCTKTQTQVYSSSQVAGSTGFATGVSPATTGAAVGTGALNAGVIATAGVGASSGSVATGSPIAPAAPSKIGSSTGPSSSGFTGGATKNVGSVAVGLLAAAAIAAAL